MLENRKRERGANLVEFALVMPLLIMLLFGIIEFGWLFAQDLTIKHGAREGARLAAVAFGADPAAVETETKGRMNATTNPGTIDVQFCVDPLLVDPSDAMDPGDAIEVTVIQPRTSLTGLMDWALASITTLSSTVEIRAEQTPTGYWTSPFCP